MTTTTATTTTATDNDDAKARGRVGVLARWTSDRWAASSDRRRTGTGHGGGSDEDADRQSLQHGVASNKSSTTYHWAPSC